MKRATLIGTLVVSLATGSAALADGRGHDHDRGGRDHDRGHSRSHQVERRDSDRRDYGRHDYRSYAYSRDGYRAPARYGYGAYYRPHGYYSHRWSRGERLPFAFYARPYVIEDYYGYGLYGPPRGYHWVRVDGDAVLAAVATGIVLDTVFHAFH
jgi:Ni/Co efflux regulator RcnB